LVLIVRKPDYLRCSDTLAKILTKTKLVEFDRVYFDRSKLTTESRARSKTLAILKNFPGAIKIGGYTDNTGDSSSTKKYPDRAMILMRLIKLRG
jgi:hypothetical protein